MKRTRRNPPASAITGGVPRGVWGRAVDALVRYRLAGNAWVEVGRQRDCPEYAAFVAAEREYEPALAEANKWSRNAEQRAEWERVNRAFDPLLPGQHGYVLPNPRKKPTRYFPALNAAGDRFRAWQTAGLRKSIALLTSADPTGKARAMVKQSNPAGWAHNEAREAVRRAMQTRSETDLRAAYTAVGKIDRMRKPSRLPNPNDAYDSVLNRVHETYAEHQARLRMIRSAGPGIIITHPRPWITVLHGPGNRAVRIGVTGDDLAYAQFSQNARADGTGDVIDTHHAVTLKAAIAWGKRKLGVIKPLKRKTNPADPLASKVSALRRAIRKAVAVHEVEGSLTRIWLPLYRTLDKIEEYAWQNSLPFDGSPLRAEITVATEEGRAKHSAYLHAEGERIDAARRAELNTPETRYLAEVRRGYGR